MDETVAPEAAEVRTWLAGAVGGAQVRSDVVAVVDAPHGVGERPGAVGEAELQSRKLQMRRGKSSSKDWPPML